MCINRTEMKTIREEKYKLIGSTYNLHNSNYLDTLTSIRTGFEQKFLDMNINIKYLKMKIIGSK